MRFDIVPMNGEIVIVNNSGEKFYLDPSLIEDFKKLEEYIIRSEKDGM